MCSRESISFWGVVDVQTFWLLVSTGELSLLHAGVFFSRRNVPLMDEYRLRVGLQCIAVL